MTLTRNDFRLETKLVTFLEAAGPELAGQTLPRWQVVQLRDGRTVISGVETRDRALAYLDERIARENALALVADLPRDHDGFPYRVDPDLGPFRVTDCCGAAVTHASDGYLCCKGCWNTVLPGYQESPFLA